MKHKNRVKKVFKRLTCLISAMGLMAVMFTFLAAPAMADATRVVTLGQDLSDEQEAFIINYFGVDLSTARVIYVNNQQEREYVGSWIPLEQIGNITISSAYVQPTNSGGIQVRTANLTYVTGNMIASVLSTAGITNCNVVAAAPFPVSGTGALTGVMIAYQEATGEALDQNKRDLAVQEFTVTQQTSESIGESEALQLINAVKMEVLQTGVQPTDTQVIEEIVDKVVSDMDQSLSISGNGNQIDSITMDQSSTVDNSVYNDYSVTNISNGLSEDDRQMLVDLASKIAEQDYDTDAVLETLERVNENLTDQTNIEINVSNGNTIENSSNSSSDNTIDNSSSSNTVVENTNTNDNTSSGDTTVMEEDSIFNDLNTESLSADVQSATDEIGMAELEAEKQQEEAMAAQSEPVDNGFPEMHEETYVYNPEVPEIPAQPEYQEPVIPEIPAQPEYQEPVIPEIPAQPEYQEPVIPEIPAQPEYQEPVIPEIPAQPEYQEPVIPEIPAQPEYQEPVIPEVPEIPDQPVMPEYEETIWPEPDDQEVINTEEPDDQEVINTEEPDDQEVINTEEPDDQEGLPEEAEPAAADGNWHAAQIPAGQTLREDVQAVWDNGPASFQGVDLTPVVYLGSRGEDELDYQIICLGNSQTQEGVYSEDTLYVVIMHEAADGTVSITNMTALDLNNLEYAPESADPEELTQNGWNFSRSPETSILDQNTATASAALTEVYPDKNVMPVILLATKQGAGTEYALLCYETPEGAERGFFEVAFVTDYEDGSTPECSLAPLNLADYE